MFGIKWQQDVPDTAWAPGQEDPIPVGLGRWRWTAFLYRWFSGRALDGKQRSNATFRAAPTEFYTKSGRPPWPVFWHSWPGWRRAVWSRGLPTAWTAPWLTVPFVAWFSGWDWTLTGRYVAVLWSVLVWPIISAIIWLVTLWR